MWSGANILQELKALVREALREELNDRPDSREELELLTADQVAELLNYPNREPVYRLKKEGKLKAVNLGGNDGKSVRFRKSEVRRFLAELEQNGTAH
jgi:excisionase family DNA binding protein